MAKAKGKTDKKDLTRDEKINLQSDLRRFGYLLPTNEEEVEEFDKIFGKTQVMFPDRLKEPRFLSNPPQEQTTKRSKVLVAGEKQSKVSAKASGKPTKKGDYFKRLVLAAHIANELHEESTFGHIKFVKVYMLCDKVCRMNLSTSYGKFAAGPLDPKQMYMFDAAFKKNKWFKITTTSYGAYKYTPDADPKEYEVWFERYYRTQLDGIARIVELFRKETSDFCEIVATLFFVWMEFLEQNKLVNEKSLIKSFYEWDERKARFAEKDLQQAIGWMNDNGIVPA
jgi:type I restriction enzyme S subunit